MKNYKAIKPAIIAITTIGLIAVRLNAMTIDGVSFAKVYEVEDTTLKIRGGGLLRYMIFVKAYAGVLYLPEDVPSDKALSDVPKRLEVEYFQSIEGEDFGPATNKMLAKNVDTLTLEKIKSAVEHHNSLYEDVKPGDRYSLTYIPGIGTELALNGEPKGVIGGEEFAAALFSIWLGPNPINQTFKEKLLGPK